MLGSTSNLPKSKQLYHLNIEGGNCQLLPACIELEELIDYYWLLSITAPLLQLDIIPDTAIDLVLCPEITEFAALYFPVSNKFTISLQGPVNYAGVCFRPAAINSLLGSELGNLRKLEFGMHTIEHLGIHSLANAIIEIRELPKLKDHFDQFWIDRLASSSDSVSPESALSQSVLIKLLEDSLGNESISSVCRSLQLSERQFRRLSNELLGLSPKKIQNVLRLQVVLTELFACESQQIYDLYYDDSHRIRELKQLTGFTPQQIRHMAEKYNPA